jgi:hypothetical protein
MLDYCTFAYLFATSNIYTPPVTTTVEIDFDIGSGGGNVFAEIALAAREGFRRPLCGNLPG